MRHYCPVCRKRIKEPRNLARYICPHCLHQIRHGSLDPRCKCENCLLLYTLALRDEK